MKSSFNELPSEILAMPLDLQQLWLTTYNDVLRTQPAIVAEMVALEVVKRRLATHPGTTTEDPVDELEDSTETEDDTEDDSAETEDDSVSAEEVVSMPTKTRQDPAKVIIEKYDNKIVVSIDLTPAIGGKENDELISHAEGNDIVIEGVLTDVHTNKQGKRFSARVLQEFADYINKHGIVGDISGDEVHAEWKSIVDKYGHLPRKEFVAHALKNRKGIVRATQAVFDGTKLWIKGVVDKRYKKFLTGVNKMSIEALVPKEYQVGDVYEGGHILGLTLVDDRAVNPRSFVREVTA